jgi:GNAT superfamily N-acetyltransferase
MSDTWRAVEIAATATHPVRLAVLRSDTPTKQVSFAEDEWPGAVHLGVFAGERLVGISSWIPRELAQRPGTPAFQLRGMATLTAHQGRGVGATLVRAGIAHADSHGAQTVWANARDAALGFYLAHGFVVIGDGFVDDTTQLPHHRVVTDWSR